MTIHEAVDVNGVSEGQTIYCEFQVRDFIMTTDIVSIVVFSWLVPVITSHWALTK